MRMRETAVHQDSIHVCLRVCVCEREREREVERGRMGMVKEGGRQGKYKVVLMCSESMLHTCTYE